MLMVFSRLVWMQLRTYELSPNIRSLASYRALNNIYAKSHCSNNHIISKIFKPMETKMQPRFGTAALAWFVQPFQLVSFNEFCSKVDPIKFIIYSHWCFLLLTVISASFLTRFLTSSWCIAIFVTAVLMSRGRLLASIGSMSDYLPLTFIFTLWFTFCVHYMKTLYIYSLIMVLFLSFIGTMYTGDFVSLLLVIPLTYLVTYKESNREVDFHKFTNFNFSPFRVISMSFFSWLRFSEGSKNILALMLLVAIFTITVQMSLKVMILGTHGLSLESIFSNFSLNWHNFLNFSYYWYDEIKHLIDFHYLISLAIILVWAYRGKIKDNIEICKESRYLLVTSLILLTLTSWANGVIDFQLLNDQRDLIVHSELNSPILVAPFILWIEPVVLTLGIIGGCQMLKKKVYYKS